MSGYEGAGTNMDGPEDGGSDVADSSIAGASPNSSMSLSDQYAEYGAGRHAAELASGMGIGREGGYSTNVGTPAQQGAFLAAGAPTPAEQIEAARPGLFESMGRGALALVGILSGTPAGVLGGALGLHSVGKSSGLFSSNPQPSDLGFSGNLGARGGFSGSEAPSLFGGVDGPPDPGYVGGAPVLGFGGAVVNNHAPATSTTSGAGLGGFPGYAPGVGLQYASPFAAAAQPSPGGGAFMLLAALASLLFIT